MSLASPIASNNLSPFSKAEVRTLTFCLHEVMPYINWLYFFHAWGLPSRFASVAKIHGCEACRQNWLNTFINKEDRTRAQEAMKLYDDAVRLMQKLDSHFHTHARIALLATYSQNDDIVVLLGETETHIPLLRQQHPDNDGFCWCLSDFIQPITNIHDVPIQIPFDPHHLAQTIGLFACCVDREMEQQEKDDDYLHLLHQTIADRLAEATAEVVHELMRTTLWGYSPNEKLTLEEMFAEQYQGKRPAVGYPSMPDQSINFVLDKLLDFSSIGITLTEHGAMIPHASTSGLMLAHPEAHHFSVGTIGEDQLRDYACRRKMSVDDVCKFLKQ